VADQTIEELETPAGDETTESTTTETPVPASSAAADSVDAAAAATAGAAKSPLEAINEALTEAAKPRRTITPKADEQALQDTRPRNADGTFKTETPEEKAERERAEKIAKETPEEKALREAEEAKNAKKPDHVNDPIDKDIKGRTAERMKFLIDTVKQQNALVEQHGALFGAIQETGASPAEFAQMVGYMKMVHSTDAKDLEAAYTVLQSELRGLAVKLGKPLPEVNLLRDPANADLVEEIRTGKITNQRAHELAVARETAKTTKDSREATRIAEQAQADEKKAHDKGVQDLDDLQKELIARDGAETFNAKYDALVPLLRPHFDQLDYKHWKETFRGFYDRMKLPAKAAAPVTPPAEKPRPLRPSAPAGGGGAGGLATEPKSALDAVNAALGM
jgi:hypothetical protein